MKYLALEYFKNLNLASYDLNIGYMSDDVVIKDVNRQATYASYEAYLDDHRDELQNKTFEVIRCDDFDDVVIVWVEVKQENQVIADYIGYFKSDDIKIHSINELWCPRSKA